MAKRLIGLTRALLLPLLFLVALDEKSSSGASQEAVPANAVKTAAEATSLRRHDPCRLLTSGEVETIIGPLAGPPYRANGAVAQPKGEDCRYEAAGGRSIRVNVTWDGGAQFIDMMGAMQGIVNQAGLRELKLSAGSAVAGEWDKAHVNQCCEFNALRGDQMVTVDVAGSQATIAQAAGLASSALRRLEKPLDIDGGAGIRSAQERAAARPGRRNVCELLPRADAEAIAGVPLLAPPKGNEESCTYEWPLGGGRYSVKLMVQWTDGFHDMRQVSSMTGQASSMLGMGKIGQSSPERNSGPWDEYSQSIIGVMAVKDDVLASIESGPFQQDIARAFIKRAFVNLAR